MKLVHMSKMFQMYATQDFSNGVDLWLAGICRYLNDAYPPLSVKVCMPSLLNLLQSVALICFIDGKYII